MEGRDCFQNKKIISSISSFVIILGVNFARYSELDQCFLSTLFNLDFFCHPVETYDIIKIGWSDEALKIFPKKKVWNLKRSIPRWWCQPIWKISVKLDHFPRVRGENKIIITLPEVDMLGRLMWKTYPPWKRFVKRISTQGLKNPKLNWSFPPTPNSWDLYGYSNNSWLDPPFLGLMIFQHRSTWKWSLDHSTPPENERMDTPQKWPNCCRRQRTNTRPIILGYPCWLSMVEEFWSNRHETTDE